MLQALKKFKTSNTNANVKANAKINANAHVNANANSDAYLISVQGYQHRIRFEIKRNPFRNLREIIEKSKGNPSEKL